MQYILLWSKTPAELSLDITNHLNDKWELYGSPYMSNTYDIDYHYQAVIKKEPEK